MLWKLCKELKFPCKHDWSIPLPGILGTVYSEDDPRLRDGGLIGFVASHSSLLGGMNLWLSRCCWPEDWCCQHCWSLGFGGTAQIMQLCRLNSKCAEVSLEILPCFGWSLNFLQISFSSICCAAEWLLNHGAYRQHLPAPPALWLHRELFRLA